MHTRTIATADAAAEVRQRHHIFPSWLCRLPRRHAAVNLFLVLLFLPPIPLGAQLRSGRAIRPSTRVGKIVISRLAVLDSESGTAGLTTRVILHESRYFLVNTFEESTIYVFDSHGKLISSVGREGQGPNEFRRIVAIGAGPADSVMVLDAGNMRGSIITPDLQIGRQFPLSFVPIENGLLVVGPDAFVVNASMGRSGAMDGAIHLFRPHNNLVWSADEAQGGRSLPAVRRLAASREDHLWAINSWTYEIEQLNTGSGKVLSSSVADADWNSKANPGPPTMVLGGKEDSLGRLWISGRARHAGQRPPSPSVRGPLGNESLSDIFDLRLEVIDWAEGRIVGGLTLPSFPGGLLGPGDKPGSMLFFTYEEGDLNTVVVWQASLVLPPPS